MAHRRSIFILLGLLASGCGRSSPSSPVSTSPLTIYPIHQESPDWSRHGRIVYVDHGIDCVSPYGVYYIDTTKAGLWILDPKTSTSRRVTAFGMTPSWSPDGQSIAFSTPYSGSIFTISADGTGLRQITGEEHNFSPRWSPDGGRLCWTRNIEPGGGVWVAASDGTGPKLLLADGGDPDWNPGSPDTIVCTLSDLGTKRRHLVAVSITTGEYRSLFTAEVSEDIRTPRYSPDGSAIAFYYAARGSHYPSIYVLARGASAPVPLTRQSSMEPTWSPDGQEVAFLAWDWTVLSKSEGTIWSVAPGTGDKQQLTHWWPSTCDTLH